MSTEGRPRLTRRITPFEDEHLGIAQAGRQKLEQIPSFKEAVYQPEVDFR